MDRSVDQNADDEWFVRMAKEGAHETGSVSVLVNSGRVSAIVITTAQLKSELDKLIEQDSRCKLMQGERYLCQLGGPLAPVDVEACGHFVVVYSDALPQSRAQRSAYCGPVKVATHDLGKPGSWIQPWLTPERSIPLMITSLALVAAGWFVARRRSKRAERAKR
jgi:hypothetical protein